LSNENKKWDIKCENLKSPLLFILIFYSIGIWRYLATGEIFYIFNFIYLGSSLAVGIFLSQALPKKNVLWSRRITQVLIGVYMLGYLGFIRGENMQIEGFFYYFFGGIFASATLHYFIAKIVGPIIFNRGWCGWACWTAMILDFLPWKNPDGRIKKLGFFRYIHYFLSMGLISLIWFGLGNKSLFKSSKIELYWLAIGNLVYYVVGIILAYKLKDNRAFCKYVCPIPIFQKITTSYSLLKIEIDDKKCIDCKLCEKNCPMGIKLLKYKNEGERVLSTECILCNTCVESCPEDAIDVTTAFDRNKGKEYLYYN